MVAVDFKLDLVIGAFKINLLHKKLLYGVLRRPAVHIHLAEMAVERSPARLKQLVEVVQHIADHPLCPVHVFLGQIPDDHVQVEVPLQIGGVQGKPNLDQGAAVLLLEGDEVPNIQLLQGDGLLVLRVHDNFLL